MQWFKLYSEWASDPKVQSMPEALQRRLAMLYCLCCQGDPADMLPHEIALWMRIPLPEWRKTRETFVDKGFMEQDGSVPKFQARQGPTDPTAAQRMRRYRERHAQRDDDVTRNGSSRSRPRGGEERRSEGEEIRGEGGEEITPPPARNVTPDGPDPDGPAPIPADVLDVARLAADWCGSAQWSAWVVRMHTLGYPAGWVKEALQTLVAKERVDMGYGEGILRSYAERGGSDRERRKGGRAATAAAPRRFDPATCLARLVGHGWQLVAQGPDTVAFEEIEGAGACLWKKLPADLRKDVEAHKAELKDHVLGRTKDPRGG